MSWVVGNEPNTPKTINYVPLAGGGGGGGGDYSGYSVSTNHDQVPVVIKKQKLSLYPLRLELLQ